MRDTVLANARLIVAHELRRGMLQMRDRALRLGALRGNLAHGFATAAGLADRGRLAPGARAGVIRLTESAGAPVLRRTWVQDCRAA